MLQLHLTDQQFYCLIRCVLYYRYDCVCRYWWRRTLWQSTMPPAMTMLVPRVMKTVGLQCLCIYTQAGMIIGNIIERMYYIVVLKLRTICHAPYLWKLARSCKHLRLLCPPDPWNLPGTALLSGFQSSLRALKSTEYKQYWVIGLLFGIKDLKTFEIAVKFTSITSMSDM